MKDTAQLFNDTLLALNRGDLRKAEDGFRKVIKADKAHVPALNLLTIVLMSAGRFAEAEPYIARAVALNKSSDVSFYNYGLISKHLNKPQQALEQFTKAIDLNPNVAETWNNRGTTFNDLKQYDAAIGDFDRAIKLNPAYGEAHFNKGKSLAELGRPDEALAMFEKAIALVPAFAEAWLGRGNALSDLKRYDEALAAYDKALSLNTVLTGALIGRGNALIDLKRYDEACAALDKAIAIDPNLAEAYMSKALAKLTVGDFAAGWDFYEWRYKVPEYHAIAQNLRGMNFKSRPSRQDIAGKDVVVLTEQGIGDEIMFAGVLPDLARDAKSIAYECDQRLIGLLGHSFPDVTFFERDDNRTSTGRRSDVVLKAGSLPYIYRRETADFPRRAFLKANEARVAYWRERLTELAPDRLTVGVSWRGGTARTRKNDRSIELERLKSLTGIAGTCFVNLQYGNVREEIDRFNETNAASPLHRVLDDINNFDELAALIAALDLVISVQNTTVHLSGALGKPCWGMIEWRPEWRYGASGDAMIWYPSVKMYRQPRSGEWNSVLESVQNDLERLTGERRRA